MHVSPLQARRHSSPPQLVSQARRQAGESKLAATAGESALQLMGHHHSGWPTSIIPLQTTYDHNEKNIYQCQRTEKYLIRRIYSCELVLG